MMNCATCHAPCCNLGHMKRSLKWPEAMAAVLAEFPYRINPDGICSQRTETGCAVYATRPWVCRTDEVRARCFPEVPADEFDRITRTACVMIGGTPHVA